MREVNARDFYAAVGSLDVDVGVRGRYTDPDYGIDFRLKGSGRVLIGRIVKHGPTPQDKPHSRYFLAGLKEGRAK